jgi:hypothetical protein
MIRSILAASILAVALPVFAAEPVVVELSFDSGFNNPKVLAEEGAPDWMKSIEQQGGQFIDEPKSWQVEASQPEGVGRLAITIDREKMKTNLVATLLFEGDEKADIAVQLLDAQNRVVVLDLFGNIVDVGAEASTNTFVIPLVKYPTAEKIVIRRISGKVNVHGLVILPVVVEGTPVKESLEELARVLGDPLSPENPLVKGLQNVARESKVAIDPVKAKQAADEAEKKKPYPPAVVVAQGSAAPSIPAQGLVAQWTFELGGGADSSGNNINGRLVGGAKVEPGIFGKALSLRKNPTSKREIQWDSMTVEPTPMLNLADNVTIAAWINFKSIAPRWGSQIVWHGDNQFGRDPWTLNLWPNGLLEMRSDRSVTGAPKFTVFEDEIYLSPKGKPMMNQHVGARSERTLAPNTWYFVTGTIGKASAHRHAIRLYVNGELVSDVTTDETVNYPTEKFYTTIGAVDRGGWQNFDGLIDEVRIYNRPLSPAEVKALYLQPRR